MKKLRKREVDMLDLGCISVRMVAWKTKIPATAIQRAIRQKQLPAVKHGRQIQFIKIEDLEVFLGGKEVAEKYKLGDWQEFDKPK